MKIFINKRIRNISILLTIIHAVALMYTPVGTWSHNPEKLGFWLAIWSAVSSTIFVNWLFVKFSRKS